MQKNLKILYGNGLPQKNKHANLHILKQSNVLQQKLISPKPCYVNKCLVTWANDLRDAIREIRHSRHFQGNELQIANIFNQSITIFMNMEYFKTAREICYSQIQFFIQWNIKSRSKNLLKFLFQPWIHLIQIARLEKNLYDAHDKLNVLNLNQHSYMFIGENKILREKLYQALNQDAGLYKSIMTQSLLERIYLDLDGHQYWELIHFIENQKKQFPLMNRIVMQEAQAIAYANIGEIQQVFHVLSQNYLQSPMQRNAVLNLRELELRLSLNHDTDVISKLVLLYETSWSKLIIHDVTLKQTVFLLHAAVVMQIAGLIEQAIKLANFCLQAARIMGDEVLQAHSLMLLHDWVIDIKDRKKIEDLMITHYFSTQYAGHRQKMLLCFNGLKHVEKRNSYNEIILLFEDILEL